MVEVVAALIWDKDKFLICQRPANKARALLWEFVGGKVEKGETKEQALIRECKEELNITINVGDIFMEVVHEYPDITVHLTLYNATIAEGVPQKLEHNDIKWITPAEIPNYDFCPADEEILFEIKRRVNLSVLIQTKLASYERKFDCTLNAFEKTVFVMVMAYSENPLFGLDDKTLEELADFLNVNFNLLEAAISNDDVDRENLYIGEWLFLDFSCFYDHTFFSLLIRIFYLYKSLRNIGNEKTKKSLIENLGIIKDAIHFFETTNAFAGTQECIIEGNFSLKHTLFDEGKFPPQEYAELLQALICLDNLKDNGDFAVLICLLAKYELKTRANALLLITATRIIMRSPCFSNKIKNIAFEMYDNLRYIVKNARIISININSIFFDCKKPEDKRTRYDNTTRMQILYGYENFDSYELRLDMSHCGQHFVHFNNSSPGSIAAFLFDEDEYEKALSRFPDLEQCFISYGNDRWALKERSNCEFNGEMKKHFDVIEKEKSHKKIFKKNYSEEEICSFVEVVSNLLPHECCKPIDSDGEYARRCFNYDVIMRNATIMHLFYFNKDSSGYNLLLKNLEEKAINYGYLNKKDEGFISSLESVCFLINIAEEKSNTTP